MKSSVDIAQKVRDGEIVKEPVAEGKRFAIVWRRGTRQAEPAGREHHEADIRRALVREKQHKLRDELLQKLKKSRLTEFVPERFSEDHVKGLRRVVGCCIRAARECGHRCHQ